MSITEYMIESRFLFGSRIRKLRKDQQLTQLQLGCIIGLDRSQISRLEHGQGSATLDTILLLADGLGVSPSELLAGIGIPEHVANESLPAVLYAPQE